ncbi:MAG TPA: hypothetical protein VH331_14410 [Allosphingosinicella sp.]|jgi:hypothetical protein|nr:hypothetical protein [Allosphingosinicella sp.]
MTDKELASLFRKHVPLSGWHIDPRAEFVGSRFYDFAREVEHHALAAGMALARQGPVPPPEDGCGAKDRPPSARGLFFTIVGWMIGLH